MGSNGSRRKLFISTAERSGDAHAARLVSALLARDPELEISGFGGSLMAAAGCDVVRETSHSASMGVGFLGHLREHFAAVAEFDRRLRRDPPAAVVCVDAPGFHFLLARLARWRGVPVIYYICPQIWAWAPWRKGKVLRYTDLLLPILSFEERFLANDRVPVVPVGHPLGDALVDYDTGEGARLRTQLGVEDGTRLLGLLPGSRTQEVTALAPFFRRVVDELRLDPSRDRIVVSCFRDAYRDVIEDSFRGCSVPVDIVEGDSRRILVASDYAIVASGTVSLEAAWFGTPTAVLYPGGVLPHAVKRWITVLPWFTLPNILGAVALGGEPVVYEHLCWGNEAAEVAQVIRSQFEDRAKLDAIGGRLRQLAEAVLKPGASARAAEAVLEFIGR